MKKTTGNDSSHAAQAMRPGGREQELLDRQALQSRMSRIQHKILVLSGKGGVGKSTVAVNLSAALAMAGKRVGLLDVDIHGPSVPKLLHIEGTPVTGGENTLYPVKVVYRPGIIKVMSIGFLLRERDDAVIWRGPRKFGVIRQFLKDPVFTFWPKCGGKVRRIIAGGTSFVLKGGGWASSGYASASCRSASSSSGQDRR